MLDWGEGNINTDPCFVDSGYWDSNGTLADANDDFWVDGDYHFLASSPCIDAGDNNSVPADVNVDLDGNLRFVDDPTTIDTGNGTVPIVDMGAYEYILKIYNNTSQTYHRTIQDAIDAAANSDKITVYPGSYTGAGNRDITFGGKSVKVSSTDPEDADTVAATIIDCRGSQSEPHRGFEFVSGETQDTRISGLTIVNGYGPQENWFGQLYSAGGAVYCDFSNPTIENCLFSNNYSNYWGGAIYSSNGDPIIKACIFTNNQAFDTGGAIYNNSSHMTVINNIFTANLADYGGAVYSLDSWPSFSNCTFMENEAASYGGAMRNNRSDVNIKNCILWGDSADSGNELYSSSSTVTVTYCDIQGGWLDTGNIDSDPCFTDPCNGDYHLKSEFGCWSESGQSWVFDDVSSPCIDAGAPTSDWTAELWPHGKRINMGAYGGTSQASKSTSQEGNIADLNKDGLVDLLDFSYFSDKWLSRQVLLPADLDRNGGITIDDLMIFCENWLWEE